MMHFDKDFSKLDAEENEVDVDYLLCECGTYIHKSHMKRHLAAKPHLQCLLKQKAIQKKQNSIKCYCGLYCEIYYEGGKKIIPHLSKVQHTKNMTKIELNNNKRKKAKKIALEEQKILNL